MLDWKKSATTRGRSAYSPLVMLPIIFYNLVQHLIAAFEATFFQRSLPIGNVTVIGALACSSRTRIRKRQGGHILSPNSSTAAHCETKISQDGLISFYQKGNHVWVSRTDACKRSLQLVSDGRASVLSIAA
jgi:hypothetical protein